MEYELIAEDITRILLKFLPPHKAEELMVRIKVQLERLKDKDETNKVLLALSYTCSALFDEASKYKRDFPILPYEG